MSAERISITLPPEDAELLDRAVKHSGASSKSAWIAHAIRETARWEIAQEVADELVAMTGEPTTQEVAWAREALGLADA